MLLRHRYCLDGSLARTTVAERCLMSPWQRPLWQSVVLTSPWQTHCARYGMEWHGTMGLQALQESVMHFPIDSIFQAHSKLFQLPPDSNLEPFGYEVDALPGRRACQHVLMWENKEYIVWIPPFFSLGPLHLPSHLQEQLQCNKIHYIDSVFLGQVLQQFMFLRSVNHVSAECKSK